MAMILDGSEKVHGPRGFPLLNGQKGPGKYRVPHMEPFLHVRRTKRDVPAESLSCTTMPLCGLPFGSFCFSVCISSKYAAISNGLN